MVYEPEKYSIGKTAQTGTKIEAVVIKIDEGRQRDFVDPEVMKKWKNPNPDQKCINVTAEGKSDEQKIQVSKTIAIPEGTNTVNQKSVMAKWIVNYGGAPKVGQKVELVVNADGYFNFRI